MNKHISWSTSVLETDIFPFLSIDRHHYYGWFGCGELLPLQQLLSVTNFHSCNYIKRRWLIVNYA